MSPLNERDYLAVCNRHLDAIGHFLTSIASHREDSLNDWDLAYSFTDRSGNSLLLITVLFDDQTKFLLITYSFPEDVFEKPLVRIIQKELKELGESLALEFDVKWNPRENLKHIPWRRP